MALRHFHISAALAPGATVTVPAALQHRLSKVLRMGQGDTLALFNGTSPLFAAEITDPKARSVRLTSTLKPFTTPTPLTLALCMPKREAWESALRQATELGATAILPLKSAFSQVARLNEERATLILTEAAEQSERLTVPTLLPVQNLSGFLNDLNQPTAWAFERQTAPAGKLPTPTILLVDPEGGFSPEEVTQLQGHPHIHDFTLGNTILRVDTAVVAALSKVLC